MVRISLKVGFGTTPLIGVGCLCGSRLGGVASVGSCRSFWKQMHMVDLVVPPDSSGFRPDRRRPSLTVIPQASTFSAAQPSTVTAAPSSAVAPQPARPADVTGLPAALQQLTAAPDPILVFTHLAVLLVPALCDEAVAVVLVDEQLARWRQRPPASTADTPTVRVERPGRGWSVTVHIPGYPAAGGPAPAETDYVAELTCSGAGAAPAAAEVALIELAGWGAADTVRDARQAALLDARQRQIEHLQVALRSNREIGAAVGVLMARRHLPYPKAFDLLLRTSQNCNRKLAAVADRVLYTGLLPRSAAPAA